MRFGTMLAVPLLLAAAPLSTIQGPDGGGWDYARVDPASRRLVVARTSSVDIFDLSGRSAPRAIGAIVRGHAALPLPNGREILVTSGGDDSVRILDIASGRETARIAVGRDPDAAVLQPETDRGYVMNARDGTVSVIDLSRRAVTDTIALRPGLEFGVVGRDGTLFVNNEDADEIETVDTRRMVAGAAIPLPGCESPSGLGYDAAGNRLIAACANGKAAIVDAGRRSLVALLDIGRGPDAVIVDGVRRRAYVPCGVDGELDVLTLRDDGVVVASRRAGAPNARTGAVDERTGRVYLPAATLGPPLPGAKRGTPIAGTFRIVVVRPDA